MKCAYTTYFLFSDQSTFLGRGRGRRRTPFGFSHPHSRCRTFFHHSIHTLPSIPTSRSELPDMECSQCSKSALYLVRSCRRNILESVQGLSLRCAGDRLLLGYRRQSQSKLHSGLLRMAARGSQASPRRLGSISGFWTR